MKERDGRQLIESLFAEGTLALDPEQEYEIRHQDYVMEMPQSGERIRGRDKMRAMQEAFPKPPIGTLRRVIGGGDVWVAEGENDYGDDVWQWVIVVELKDGKILRETRYYGQPFPAPEWRAAWVEPMDGG
jgi:hypothetical protein